MYEYKGHSVHVQPTFRTRARVGRARVDHFEMYTGYTQGTQGLKCTHGGSGPDFSVHPEGLWG